ncbi:MAG TPA: hypothetical protein VH637_03690 [Streptosporangiaceae bacterium]|jgi:hypothetical protein
MRTLRLLLPLSILASLTLALPLALPASAASSGRPHAQASHGAAVVPQGNGKPCMGICWQIYSIGKAFTINGTWRDCVQVSPTPGFKKSYTCSFTGTISNSFSNTIGLSADLISVSVGYSVTYSTSITGGTTYTPVNQKARGEVEWANQYSANALHERQLDQGKPDGKTRTGRAQHWEQPVSRFIPAGTTTASTAGTFRNKHWSCKNRCP